MDGKKLTLFSCCVVISLSLLLPIHAGAAESKVITPVLSLLLRGEAVSGGTCSSGAQTVKNYAGHEWQRCDDGHVYNWDAANAYCVKLHLDGHSDWRLPTKDELKSLVVCTNGTPTPPPDYPGHPNSCGDGNAAPYTSPTIDKQFSCQSAFYWSSSVYGEGSMWIVSFSVGATNYFPLAGSFPVRCVR